LTPPSSSSKDCDAAELDCAPSKGVKLNIEAAPTTGELAQGLYQKLCIIQALDA